MSVLFLILGALLFAAGIMFERTDFSLLVKKNENVREEIKPNLNLAKQWENLLGYDGTAKEEEDDSK